MTYSTYIAGLCESRNIEDAFWQLEIMVAKGLQLTMLGLNILLDYAEKDLDTLVAKEVLEQCEELGFEVDINTVMVHFSKMMKWLYFIRLFMDLLKKPITPNAQTYNILISSLCRAGNF